jgi:hypothetical protein
MITDMFTTFKRQTKSTSSSDYGGKNPAYTDGASFNACAAQNTSNEMKIAEQNGAKTLYDIITVDTLLVKDELIKRVSDSAIFRVTSDSVGCVAPTLASIAYKQATAERVVT